MQETFLLPVLTFILIVSAFVWFYLVKMLYFRLEHFHPNKFEEMGKPGILWNNSIKTNYALMKFLMKREHKILEDPLLSKLSDFILAYMAIYFILFFLMAVSFKFIS